MATNDSIVVGIQNALKNMKPEDMFTQVSTTGTALEKQVIKEFKTDPPAKQFILLHESWWVSIAFFTYVKEVLNPNTEYNDINSLFTSMQGTSNTFLNDIENQVVALAQGVMNHADNAQGHLKTVQETIMNEAIGASQQAKDFAKMAFKSSITQMKQDCDTQKAQADAIRTKMTQIAADLENDKTSAVQLQQKYTKKDGVLSNAVEFLTQQIKLDQSQVDTYHSQYEKWCKLAETAPVYLAIPFVGPFISVADAITFTTLALVWLDKYKDAKETLLKDQQQLQTDNMEIQHLNHALDVLGKVKSSLDIMIPLVDLIAGAWSNYASSLDNLDKNADALFADGTADDFKTLSAAYDLVNVVQQNWTTVKSMSATWASIAKINNLPIAES
ncbi:MAG: hypothetical protein KDC34_17175 [Saprospiraceae bacterium]|nr:hypothetical protein [Saprospiraceae bacterium]